MSEIKTMFDQQDLAFVATIGTLVRPTTLTDFNRKNAIPRGLFSHFEQQVSWQTSIPQALGRTGWIGRMSEMLMDPVANSHKVSMNISMEGVNRLQAGAMSAPYTYSNLSKRVHSYAYDRHTKASMNRTLLEDYNGVLKNHFNYTKNHIIEQSEMYASALSGASIRTEFPDTSLGKQLKQVALTIAKRGKLGANRQTFFVQLGRFDTHMDLHKMQNLNLPQVSQALFAFNSAMKELGLHDDVVTYTASDFGRTMVGNGSGTDHGWGGNQMIMGGAVKGGRIFGDYPEDLSLGTALDTGSGRQLPTTSADQLHAELAQWFGVNNGTDMEEILPNIREFWGRNAAPTLGFMA